MVELFHWCKRVGMSSRCAMNLRSSSEIALLSPVLKNRQWRILYILEARATMTDNYQPLRWRELPYKCSLLLSKLHIGAQMIHTGLSEFRGPGAVWYHHRECNIFESLGFVLLSWTDAFASRYCCSAVLSDIAPRPHVSLLPSECTQGSYNPSMMSCERVKSKRPAGANVPVK